MTVYIIGYCINLLYPSFSLSIYDYICNICVYVCDICMGDIYVCEIYINIIYVNR